MDREKPDVSTALMRMLYRDLQTGRQTADDILARLLRHLGGFDPLAPSPPDGAAERAFENGAEGIEVSAKPTPTPAPGEAQAAGDAKTIRAEIMRLMREDFDPTPQNWEGREWHDNAEDVADKIMALAARPAAVTEAMREAPEPHYDIVDGSEIPGTGPPVISGKAVQRAASIFVKAYEEARPTSFEKVVWVYAGVRAVLEDAAAGAAP